MVESDKFEVADNIAVVGLEQLKLDDCVGAIGMFAVSVVNSDALKQEAVHLEEELYIVAAVENLRQ